MKLSRIQWILAIVLLLQIALSAFAFWPRGGTAGGSEPMLPGLVDGDVVGITVTDAEATSITLHKATGEWVLPSADDYPANAEQIDPLLEKIAALTTQRLVTRNDLVDRALQNADIERKLERDGR